MAKQASLFLPANVNTFSFTGTAITAGTKNTIFTAGSNDSDVKCIIAATDDTSAVNLQLFVTRSGTDYLIGTINIPTLAGTNGTAPSVDILNSGFMPGLPQDQTGKRYLPLKTGDVLKVAPVANMTSAKILYVNVFGYDY